MTWFVIPCVVLAVGILSIAALHDIAVRTVPNTLVLLLAAVGAVLAAVQQHLLPSLALSALLLLGTGVLWRLGVMGGGDAKLLAACALLVAPGELAALLLATALAGGLLSLPFLPGRRLFARPPPGRPGGIAARLLRCERWRLSRRGPLPYAVAIAAGSLFVLLHKG